MEGNAEIGYRILADGQYKATLELLPPFAEGATLESFTTTLFVDATAPEIRFEGDVVGGFVEAGADGPATLALKGSAEDAISPLVSIRINDSEMVVASGAKDLRIDTTVSANWGLSVIRGEAEDACGNVGHIALPILRSPSFYDAATLSDTDMQATVSDSVTVQLSQNFLDDFDRTDADDIATAAQRAIDAYDFEARLPEGELVAPATVPSSCSGIGFKTGVEVYREVGKPMVLTAPTLGRLEIMEDVLVLEGTLGQVDFPAEVILQVRECPGIGFIDWKPMTLKGAVRLNSAEIKGSLGLGLVSGVVSASVESAELELDGLEIDIECGLANKLCEKMTDGVVSAMTKSLTSSLRETLDDSLAPLLEEALSSLEVSQTLELEDPVTASLSANARLETLRLCGAGDSRVGCELSAAGPAALIAVLSTRIVPEARGANISVDAPGAIRLPNGPTAFSSHRSVGFATRLDTLNQALWALWYSGALDLGDMKERLEDVLPEGAELSVSFDLPPVLSPGPDSKSLTVGLGGIRIQASLDLGELLETNVSQEISTTLRISTLASGRVFFDEAEGLVRLTLPEVPEVYFDVLELEGTSEGDFLGEFLGDLVASELPGVLEDFSAELPVPSLSVDTVSGLEGTEWRLGDVDLRTDAGLLSVGASLTLQN